MELKQYFHIIVKWLWLVLSLPILASIAAGYISIYHIDPIYESNTTLYVLNRNNDLQSSIAYQDMMAGQYLVKDYSEIVKSRTVTRAVIDELKLEWMSEENLAKKVSVNAKNDTRLIEIKVQDQNPESARQIADSVASTFIIKVKEFMKVENVSVVDKANLPQFPVEPNHKINIAIAFLAGLMAALGIVFLIEYLDDTIKTKEDVQNYLGLSVLGNIPELSLE